MEKNYFASIEFGSLYCSLIVLSYHDSNLYVVGSLKIRSQGFYDGKITDEELFKNTINSAKEKIYTKFKINVDEVILVLPNNNHKIYQARVSNKVLTERQIIGKQQIDAIRNQINSAKVNDEEVLVQEIPVLYSLDSDRVLRTPPINYQSSILTIKSNVHTLPRDLVYSLNKALNECGIKVIGQIISCFCGAIATSGKYDLENECIHINIGQEVTTISSFNKSELIKTVNLNLGVETLVNHLKETLNIDEEYALKLFESFFVADVDYTSDIVFDKENNISEKRISGIILNKVHNGFNMIINECNKLASESKFSGQQYLLLTGWLNDYEYFANEFYKNCSYKLKEGNIDVIGLDSQSFVNCYGAILTYITLNKELVIKRLENEESNDSSLTVDKLSNVKSNESNSRFKDIFDD